MSQVRVVHPHTLPADEARGRLGDFSSLLAKYGVKLDWKGNHGQIKGTGVSGDVRVTDAEVDITVKLGLVARAVVDSARLEKSIRKRLVAAFED